MVVAVLENPNYILNIGNAIRNVNGLGVDALFVIDRLKRLDDHPESLKKRKSVVKHSSGAVQFTQVKRFDTTAACFDFLESNGFTSVGTSPDSRKASCFLHEATFDQPKLAVWFGDEGNGLSSEAIGRCESCVAIEMKGEVESFSLGNVTGMILWEVMRQRK